VVLECVAARTAGEITKSLQIPTIGIGSGPLCDGQILVVSDLLGLYGSVRPKFAKPYADLQTALLTAFSGYKKEVEEGIFPGEEHSF
jgi:3-methyl-2-oxobutanoate hydroxymethyltransferase